MTTSYRLHVFDYNYSSWSMRAGVVMRLSGVDFTESCVRRWDDPRAATGTLTPSGLWPMLEHGQVRVWDSLSTQERARAMQDPSR